MGFFSSLFGGKANEPEYTSTPIANYPERFTISPDISPLIANADVLIAAVLADIGKEIDASNLSAQGKRIVEQSESTNQCWERLTTLCGSFIPESPKAGRAGRARAIENQTSNQEMIPCLGSHQGARAECSHAGSDYGAVFEPERSRQHRKGAGRNGYDRRRPHTFRAAEGRATRISGCFGEASGEEPAWKTLRLAFLVGGAP